MAWLQGEIVKATTADLQRAAAFLEFARLVRAGSTKQRTASRKAQASAWRKHVEEPLHW